MWHACHGVFDGVLEHVDGMQIQNSTRSKPPLTLSVSLQFYDHVIQ